jgi:hypothetical protein
VAAAWLFFAVLTWVHVWANIRALRCLVLSSVNEPRLKLLLQHYQDKVRLHGMNHTGMARSCMFCHSCGCMFCNNKQGVHADGVNAAECASRGKAPAASSLIRTGHSG